MGAGGAQGYQEGPLGGLVGPRGIRRESQGTGKTEGWGPICGGEEK